MPQATIRGVEINYEVLGERGAWVALQPGGRRGLEGVKSLGQKLAEAGHRVLVYDRRNCGASGISFDGGNSENEVWAEDLHALLSQLDAAPAFIGGSSSGCRLRTGGCTSITTGAATCRATRGTSTRSTSGFCTVSCPAAAIART